MKALWTNDFSRLSDAIAAIPGAILLIGGQKFIDSSIVPDGLLNAYNSALSLGYANGWV